MSYIMFKHNMKKVRQSPVGPPILSNRIVEDRQKNEKNTIITSDGGNYLDVNPEKKERKAEKHKQNPAVHKLAMMIATWKPASHFLPKTKAKTKPG